MEWIKRSEKIKPNKNDSAIDKIAKIRGIKDTNRFLNPTVEELFDPYLIKNIEDACNRIIKAIKRDERIVVSYDPDADGLTSTTIMRRYLSNYTDNVDYIYGERNHGHGIAEQLGFNFIPKAEEGIQIDDDKMDRLHLNADNLNRVKDADLLIIIDSSSNDVDMCRKIKEDYGVEVIIIDHHEIEVDNPHVLLVNPQQDGDEYPNKQLSGAGVVFKVIQVIEDTLNSVDIWQYIDLVSVGMYSDIMKLNVYENRYLIMQGMRNMKNVGLVRILKGAKVDTFRVNSSNIGFAIAPLLNGVARMDKIKLAIDILMTDDDNIAKKLRLQMKKINDQRKILQKEIVEKYNENIDSSQKVLVVLDEQSSKGFNGIVAQNLSERYMRPVIVGRLHKGTASGSFRSYGNFQMKDFLVESGLLEQAMGHPQAGGFTVKEENLEALLEYIENNMPEIENKEPFVFYDIEIEADDISEYVNAIEQFNLLTGNGFPKITVKVNNLTVDSVACIGETQETVKIKTFDDLELIKFRVNDQYASDLGVFDNIEVVGELNVNRFYNFKLKETIITNQVMIDDYKTI